MSGAENGADTPLKGVRVVETGNLLAGPFCGQLLADFGMEVIEVEPPGEVRWAGPKLGQHNYEVYKEVLGFDEEERDGLRERGII